MAGLVFLILSSSGQRGYWTLNYPWFVFLFVTHNGLGRCSHPLQNNAFILNVCHMLLDFHSWFIVLYSFYNWFCERHLSMHHCKYAVFLSPDWALLWAATFSFSLCISIVVYSLFIGLCWAEICNKHCTNTLSWVVGDTAVAHFSPCCPKGLGLLICFARYNKVDGNPKMGAIFKGNGNKREICENWVRFIESSADHIRMHCAWCAGSSGQSFDIKLETSDAFISPAVCWQLMNALHINQVYLFFFFLQSKAVQLHFRTLN